VNYKGLSNFYSLKKITFVAVFSALLSSCATMQENNGSTVSTVSRSENSRQNGSSTAARQNGVSVEASSSAQGAQGEQEDPGINRTGRIIQLGRFVEDRPQVEVPKARRLN